MLPVRLVRTLTTSRKWAVGLPGLTLAKTMCRTIWSAISRSYRYCFCSEVSTGWLGKGTEMTATCQESTVFDCLWKLSQKNWGWQNLASHPQTSLQNQPFHCPPLHSRVWNWTGILEFSPAMSSQAYEVRDDSHALPNSMQDGKVHLISFTWAMEHLPW